MNIELKQLEFVVYLPGDLFGGNGATKHQFRIAIQDNEQFPDLQGKYIELTPKFEAYISVSVHLHSV